MQKGKHPEKMSAKDFDIGYIRYVGFSELDSFEKKRIESIVSRHVEKVKKSADFLGLRIHLKVIHQKSMARQEPLNQIDAVLETSRGHFSTASSNRNPYSAVAEVLESLQKQLEHKRPQTEEWKKKAKRQSRG